MSGYYDNSSTYQQQSYNQYPRQGYYDQSHQQSSYPAQGYADSRSYQQSSNQDYYSSNQQYYNQQQPSMSGGTGPEADRGLLGAVGGGIAGGAAGHKFAGHGILGTIGGAIVGSLAEDYGKKKHKQHKYSHGSAGHHHGRRDASSVGSQSGSGLGAMASSFFNQKR